jgi:hypothetical protein
MSDGWAELKTSRFFKKEDVIGNPLTYTIKSIAKETVDFKDTKEVGTVVSFEETDRQVFGKTVIVNNLIELFPAGPSAAIGQKVELYEDPSVMMGPKKVGGLRIRAAKVAKAPF